MRGEDNNILETLGTVVEVVFAVAILNPLFGLVEVTGWNAKTRLDSTRGSLCRKVASTGELGFACSSEGGCRGMHPSQRGRNSTDLTGWRTGEQRRLCWDVFAGVNY